jgi:hypothetical protein
VLPILREDFVAAQLELHLEDPMGTTVDSVARILAYGDRVNGSSTAQKKYTAAQATKDMEGGWMFWQDAIYGDYESPVEREKGIKVFRDMIENLVLEGRAEEGALAVIDAHIRDTKPMDAFDSAWDRSWQGAAAGGTIGGLGIPFVGRVAGKFVGRGVDTVARTATKGWKKGTAESGLGKTGTVIGLLVSAPTAITAAAIGFVAGGVWGFNDD